MSKQRLIKRLEWYYPTEKFNAFLFFGLMLVLFFFYAWQDLILLTYGLLLMIFILYQGQKYWKVKLHRLQGKPLPIAELLREFCKYKKLNVYLAWSGLPFVVWQAYAVFWASPTEDGRTLFFWGIVAYLFGIAEHVNYYHRQLMIDNPYDVRYVLRNKKLKEASLAKDLREGRF